MTKGVGVTIVKNDDFENFKKIGKCQSCAFFYFYFKMRIKLT